MDDRFLARLGDPIELHPAADRDEEGSCRIALAKYALLRPMHGRRGGGDDVLDGLRLETAEHGDARDDLQVAGERFGGHAGKAPRDMMPCADEGPPSSGHGYRQTDPAVRESAG